MDVQMPIMDGCHATSTVRTHEWFENSAWTRNTPIVAMTATDRNAEELGWTILPSRPKENCWRRCWSNVPLANLNGSLLKKMISKLNPHRRGSIPARSSLRPTIHIIPTPLPIYPKTAAPKESLSISCPQSLTTQLSQVGFERIAALLDHLKVTVTVFCDGLKREETRLAFAIICWFGQVKTRKLVELDVARAWSLLRGK